MNERKQTSLKDIKVLRKEQSQGKKYSYDYLFKISLIGNSGVGKTSILLRFTENTYKEDTTSTIGVDFKIISFSIGDNIFTKMQIWDTCGSERFKSLTASFIKSCPVFILVFDLTNKKSFTDLENWIKIINENTSPKLLNIVGNKSDLKEKRAVELTEILSFANKNNLNYIEVSAKDDFNIEDLFIDVTKRLYEEASQNKDTKQSNNSTAFDIGGFRNVDSNNNSKSNVEGEVNGGDENKGKENNAVNNSRCNC